MKLGKLFFVMAAGGFFVGGVVSGRQIVTKLRRLLKFQSVKMK